MSHIYEKLDENQKLISCPHKDTDGSITGHIVFGVPQYFDENPEERIRLGWVKHILKSRQEVEYDPQTQYLVKSIRQIDEHTVEDEYHVMEKSEEMLWLEELLTVANDSIDVNLIWNGGDPT